MKALRKRVLKSSVTVLVGIVLALSLLLAVFFSFRRTPSGIEKDSARIKEDTAVIRITLASIRDFDKIPFGVQRRQIDGLRDTRREGGEVRWYARIKSKHILDEVPVQSVLYGFQHGRLSAVEIRVTQPHTRELLKLIEEAYGNRPGFEKNNHYYRWRGEKTRFTYEGFCSIGENFYGIIRIQPNQDQSGKVVLGVGLLWSVWRDFRILRHP